MQPLLKLFDLTRHGKLRKSGECLDRAADVDPYERRSSEAGWKVCAAKFRRIGFKLIASA